VSELVGADIAGIFSRAILGLVVAASIAFAGLRTRALTRSGAVAAVFVGTAVYAGAGLACAAALIAFFATGSALSHAGGDAAAGSGAKRDAHQVLANGGVAALCAAASAAIRWIGLHHVADGLALAAVVSIAGVAGDTWASEIGSRAGGRPRLITTFAEVKPRTNGAVTWLGTAAAIAGGALVGLIAGFFGFGGSAAAGAAIGGASGLVGSTIDSLLGASIQTIWYCRACDGPSDVASHSCGAAAVYVRGIAGVDNDAVNALTSASLAGLAAAVFFIV
jgi:uncharacterized protein (TIGR00297 family)